MSAQAIINAILAGERDPEKLAALRDKRCRSSAEDIIEALRGEDAEFWSAGYSASWAR